MVALTTGAVICERNCLVRNSKTKKILFCSFEASNGIKQQNTGFLKRVLIPQTREDGTETGEKVEGDVLVQTGSYSFTGNLNNTATNCS